VKDGIIKIENRSSWRLVIILVGAGVVSAFQVGKVPPLLPDIQAELVISLFYAGWILSIFNITGLLLGTFTGAIADTIGHRRLLIFGIGLQALASFAGSLASSFNVLIVTRLFEGMGFIAVIVSAPTLIFQVVKKNDTKVALSIWSCYLPAGASLVMFLIPLISRFTDWRGAWQVNSILLTFYLIILIYTTSGITPFKRENQLSIKNFINDIKETLTCPGPILLSLIFTTYALQWLAVMGFLPTLLIEKFEFSKQFASILTAIMVGVNIIGNLAGGRLLKFGIKRWVLIAIASFIMGSCSIAIYSEANFFINYTGCILFSLIGGLIPASVLGGSPVYAPSERLISTTTGMLIQGGQSGQVFGPIILAWIVSSTGTWSSGFWFLGCVAGLGILFSLGLAKLKIE
jgi:MFS family permease